MRGFSYLQNEHYDAEQEELIRPDLEVFNQSETEEPFTQEDGSPDVGLESVKPERAQSLPIGPKGARGVAEWMRENFETEIIAATNDTPFSPTILCSMVCQETGYFWAYRTDEMSVADILARCVLDANGDARGSSRSAKPRNTREFRSDFGDEFAEMLITEANDTRKIRGYGPARWVYKGYGIFQYDLQYVYSDESYFRDKQWYEFDVCLAKAMGELKEKYRIHRDLWTAVRAYNGAGSRARQYARNVRQFTRYCAPVWETS